jgi:sugar lactone lactonase YvrE
MAVGKDVLYTADSWTKTLHRHKLDDHLTVLQTVPHREAQRRRLSDEKQTTRRTRETTWH